VLREFLILLQISQCKVGNAEEGDHGHTEEGSEEAGDQKDSASESSEEAADKDWIKAVHQGTQGSQFDLCSGIATVGWRRFNV
jgi:hypothetical protein